MLPNNISKSCFPKSEDGYFASSWSEHPVPESFSPYYNQSPRKDSNCPTIKTSPIKPQPMNSASPPYDQCSCSMCLSYKSYYNTFQWPCREATCPCNTKSYSTSPPQTYQYLPQFPYHRQPSLFTNPPAASPPGERALFDSLNSNQHSHSTVNYPEYIKEMNSSRHNSYIHIDTEAPSSISPQRPVASQVEQSPSFSSSSSAALSLSQTSPDGIQFLKSIDPIECNSAHRQDANNKPPYSYITLIVSAMRSKSSRKITLNEIYAWIMSNFAYYRRNVRRWQNSIRHALSFNDCFIKVPRPSGEAGKGNYWTVHPNAIDMFENGSTMRRNRKFIDSSKDAVSPKRRRNSTSKSPCHLNYTNASTFESESPKEAEKSMIEQSDLLNPQIDYRIASCALPDFPSSMRSDERRGESLLQQSLNLCHSDYSGSYRVWGESQLHFPMTGDVC